MRKSFYLLLLAALTVGFAACNDNDGPSSVPTSKYAGVWVSDSVLNDNGGHTQDVVMWEILDDSRIKLHGLGICSWKLENEHFFTFSQNENTSITLEGMELSEDQKCMDFYVYGGNTDMLNIWDGGKNLFMYRLPQPKGNWIPVSKSAILGKWRYGYEENISYDSEFNETDRTRFNHVGLETWEFLDNGKVIVRERTLAPVTKDWDVSSETLTIDNLQSYYVALKSNYMCLRTFNTQPPFLVTNEQFFFRMD